MDRRRAVLSAAPNNGRLVQMSYVLLTVLIFAVACAISWYPGNKLLWFVWKKIAAHVNYPAGTATKLAPAVGGLERVLYIFGILSGQYILITGWLVMKAFFVWIDARARAARARKAARDLIPPPMPPLDVDVLAIYNSVLIGNLLSILIALACGLAANWVIQHLCA